MPSGGSKKGRKMNKKKKDGTLPAFRRVIKGLSNKYLSRQELSFVDEYIKAGFISAWPAYKKAFGCKESTAKARAYQCLKKPNVIAEIRARVEASGITKDWINDKSKKYVVKGLQTHQYAGAGTKSLELLARMSGLLEDTTKVIFDGENPALFMPIKNKKDEEELEDVPRLVE